jgi:hypothetical protein
MVVPDHPAKARILRIVNQHDTKFLMPIDKLTARLIA